MRKLIKYKLVDQEGYTHRGMEGETYWLNKTKKVALGKGVQLCTNDVIHYYDHPLLAVLFNPIHANIENPRLIEIQIDKQCAHDGLKGGCKKAKYLKKIKLPIITPDQRVTFAIKISLRYCKDEKYRKWAKNWINGKDRSVASAARLAASALRLARSAVRLAASAARSAASAARSAACPAESAESVARLARSAARSAESVASAARSAEKINKLFIKTIKEIANE